MYRLKLNIKVHEHPPRTGRHKADAACLLLEGTATPQWTNRARIRALSDGPFRYPAEILPNEWQDGRSATC